MKTKMVMLLITLTLQFYGGLVMISQAQTTEKAPTKKTINEGIEWTNTWVVSAEKKDLPKVLVIGDSHVQAYYPVLSDQFKGKAYISKFTTSKSFGDPLYVEQLEWFLKSYSFDVISINNGLHGKAFTLHQYGGDLSKVYSLFKKYQPRARIVWVNTTARRIANHTSELDSLNSQVCDRNEVVAKFCTQKQISLVDLYTLSFKNPGFYQNDGIHFIPEGVKEEANEVGKQLLTELQKK